MHKIKKIAYCIITIILLLSILSLTYFSGERVKPTQHWNAEQIKEHSALVGYSLEYDEELKTEVYKSLIDISHIILPHDGSNYNTVVVKLAGDSIQDLDEADKKQDEAEDVAEKKEIIEKNLQEKNLKK